MTHVIDSARSYLFVPGHRDDRYEKALASEADMVVVDLEDAVPEGQKDEARDRLLNWLRPEHQIVVRINSSGSRWFAADLEAATHPGIAAVLVPKVETTDEIATVCSVRADLHVHALIESARGFARLDKISNSKGVGRLVFGAIDFQLDMGMECGEQDLLYYRSAFVLASRVAGLQAPIDGVCVSIIDTERIRAEARYAKRLGFGGKLCIHPGQTAIVNEAFAPSDAAVQWAMKVVEADERSGGAPVTVDGAMIDRPVVLRARVILTELAKLKVRSKPE